MQSEGEDHPLFNKKGKKHGKQSYKDHPNTIFFNSIHFHYWRESKECIKDVQVTPPKCEARQTSGQADYAACHVNDLVSESSE